ncbi:uncharacterized protein LOC144096977 [Amblyomma americanum]
MSEAKSTHWGGTTEMTMEEETKQVPDPNLSKAQPSSEATPARYKCSKCSYSTNLNYNLARHRQSLHERRPSSASASCCETGKTIKTLYELQQHKLQKHRMENLCHICGEKFSRPSHRDRHLRSKSHKNEKPFACPFCGASFNAAWNMRRHRGSNRCAQEVAKRVHHASHDVIRGAIILLLIRERAYRRGGGPGA